MGKELSLRLIIAFKIAYLMKKSNFETSIPYAYKKM